MNLAKPMVVALSTDLDAPAFEYVNRSTGATLVQTRGDLLTLAGRWQGVFTQRGLVAGDEIALSPSRGPHLPALHLAALAAGLSIVPLNSALSQAEFMAVLSDARANLVISGDDVALSNQTLAARLAKSGIEWITESAVPAVGNGAQKVSVHELAGTDTAMTIYTSGTTGEPKSVPLSHANLLANLEALGRAWQRDARDRLLHMLPAHHYHGLVLGVYGSMLAANTVVVLESFDARGSLDAMRERSINLLMAVPTMYSRMLTAATAEDSFDDVRLAVSGSAPLTSSLWHAFTDRFGVALINRYGLTETGIATSTLPDSPRAGSVGVELPGTTVRLSCAGEYVAPEPGKRSPVGEICIKGPTVTAGYGNNPAATAAAIHDGYFHSGDLGYFDEDGHLFVSGRIKELIIVGGSNVIPGEVAEVLATVEQVEDVAVVGQADDDLGEIVAAYIVARGAAVDEAAQQELEQTLRTAAAAGLARYKQPRLYRFIDEIPRNATGKIDRARLTSEYA